MAPSPAAGKSDSPRTPTKLGRKPQSSQTSRLGQQTQSAQSPQSADTPSKPETSTPDPPAQADQAKGQAEQTQSKAEDASKKAEDPSKNELKDSGAAPAEEAEETGDDAGGKVSQAAQETGDEASSAEDDLTEQAPQPVEEDDEQEKAGEQGDEEEEEDVADDATEKAGDTAEEAEETGDEAGEHAEDAADDAQEQTNGSANDAQEQAGEAGEQVEAAGEEAQEQTGGRAGGMLSGAKSLAGRASNLAGKARQDPTEAAQDAPNDVQDTAEDAAGDTTDQAEDAKGAAEDTTGKELPEGPADLSALKGLEVGDDGTIRDKEGNPVGRLAEGDAEDLAGYTIGDNGEILDDDGDLVGVAELMPEKTEELQGQAQEAQGTAEESAEDTAGDTAEDTAEDTAGGATGQLPGPEVLKGQTVNQSGDIIDEDGDTIGQLTEGDAGELTGKTLNEKGEVVDEDGNVVGRAKVMPEAMKYADQAKEAGDGVQGEAEGAADGAADGVPEGAEEAVDGVKHEVEGAAPGVEDEAEGAAPGVEDEAEGAVPGVKDEAEGAVLGVEDVEGQVDGAKDTAGEQVPLDPRILEGYKVNKKGKVLDEDGEELGSLTEGDPKAAAGQTVNAKGEVVDKQGNVVGRVQVTPGEAAEEAMKNLQDKGADVEEEDTGLPSLDILDGLKVNKKGQVLDEDGEPIGELSEGDLKDCAGKKCNDKGEVLDKNGNVVGKVKTLPKEPEEAADETVEAAQEAAPEDTGLPGLDSLNGMTVNKKGQILDADGEPIGELEEGDPKECAGKKVNDKGQVLDQDGNVIGKVRTLSQQPEEAAPEEEEDAGPQLPPLSVLEGLPVNKQGKLVNKDGVVVGELIEGDAKKISKSGITSDSEGQFWDNKGHIIGRAQTVPVEEPEAESPFAGLEGLIVVKDGKVEDENGNVVGQVVEGDPKKLIGRSVDEDGDIIDKNGTVVGHAERYEEEEPEPEAEPEKQDLSVLAGRPLNKQGYIIGDEQVPIGRLVEGHAKELAGKKPDADGNIWNDAGKIVGRVELIPEDERESKPEGVFGGLEDLRVNKDGKVIDADDNIVGEVVEGNVKRLVGMAVDEDGDIVDKYGNVKGHAEPLEEEPEPEKADLSFLRGLPVNKQGNVIGPEGVPVARLVEGNIKEIAGKKCDDQGQIWNDAGKVIGRVELIPENEREAKPEGPFAGLEGLRVIADGKVADEDDNIVGEIVEGNPKRLIGLAVDEDGDIIDKYGNVKGHAEPLPEEEEKVVDNSILEGKPLNKQGFVVGEDRVPVGRLVEGNLSELVGRKCDREGKLYNDVGKQVGQCEVIPENERVSRPEGPFAGLEGLKVVKDGKVEDGDGNIVGEIVEGNPKRLVGHTVDEDGEIVDKFGNTIGRAEPYEEPEEQQLDLTPLQGCTVNKAGNVVNDNGKIVGRITDGDPSIMAGKKVDGKGQIWDNAGNVIGHATVIEGADTGGEGPFAGFEGLTVHKDGTVRTQNDEIVGRVVEGDIKKLIAHKVDEQGDIIDKNGNSIGKAERWEPEEKERRINPMAGRTVNKDGEVRDQDGNLMGILTAGDLGHCVGCEIDDNGYVIDNDGNRIGEVTLLENLPEDQLPEGLSEEQKEEIRQKKERRELAKKMNAICQQTIEKMQPICKQITDILEKADRTPKEELDEEEVVNQVKPLIEEGGRILQECNGSLRGLDPDGSIAAQAKGHAQTGEASPEEYQLAESLKELTSTVVKTIDDAKKKLNDMPHAKKKLNPLWGLMTQPLFQILAAVGLLLTGVLNLVGQLLNGLGLGGLVNGILGGLGIDKILEGFGLGGGKGKGKGGGLLGGLPIVGGLLGGGGGGGGLLGGLTGGGGGGDKDGEGGGGGLLGGLGKTVGGVTGGVGKAVGGVTNAVGDTVGGVGKSVGGPVGGLAGGVGGAVKGVGGAAQGVTKQAGGAVGGVTKTAGKATGGLL